MYRAAVNIKPGPNRLSNSDPSIPDRRLLPTSSDKRNEEFEVRLDVGDRKTANK